MAVEFEDDVSGSGIGTFSPAAVDHVRLTVSTMPSRADFLDTTFPREVIRVGWIALGGTFAEGVEGETTYNLEKKWIEFESQAIIFSVPPHPAQHIRWRIWPGGVVHLIVAS